LASFEQKWQTFSRLSGFERGAAIEASVALAITWLGLRLAGFRRWKSVLEWLAPRNSAVALASPESETARAIARMEAAAARNLFFRPNCLERSLVLWWLLCSRGIRAELRIGARKQARTFEAHAWVESGGSVIGDPGETHLHFAPFDGPIASLEPPAP
jgi:Transglutaminase-like superfamily